MNSDSLFLDRLVLWNYGLLVVEYPELLVGESRQYSWDPLWVEAEIQKFASRSVISPPENCTVVSQHWGYARESR